MAKTQPTAEQWRDIEERLGKMWDTVYMECDGFLVAFTLKRVEKMRLAIAVYVNGWFKGEWLGLGRDKPPSEEGRRFYQERTCSVHRGKTKVMVRRAFGKKESEKKFSYRSSVWASAKSLRRHLVAHNENIRLLTHEEYEAAIEAQPKDETEATA